MEGLTERFDEAAEGEEYSKQQADVARAIVRQYEESLRNSDEGADADGCSEKLNVIAETLDGMEPWERVLLRCRALDVPYEEIATYTGKPVKQLKVYHGRIKKKFVKLLAQRYPELAGERELNQRNETV